MWNIKNFGNYEWKQRLFLFASLGRLENWSQATETTEVVCSSNLYDKVNWKNFAQQVDNDIRELSGDMDINQLNSYVTESKNQAANSFIKK